MTRPRTVLGCLLLGAAVQGATAAPLTYANYDTRSGGTVAVVSTPSLDGNGSLRLTTDSAIAGSGNAKAGVALFRPDLQPLGLLGSLTSASFDYRVEGTNTTPTNSAPAVRFFLNPGLTQALVWERAYQPGSQGIDAWQDDVNLIGSSLLWQRGNGTNFDAIAQMRTLPDWINGYAPNGGVAFSANTPIYGIGISFGSGIGGQFTGYIDDVRLTFGDGAAYAADFAVPEPATTLTFGLLAAGGGWYLRRRKAAVV